MREATGENVGGRWQRYPTGVWSVAAVFVLTTFATRYVQMDISPVYLGAVVFGAWRGGPGAGWLANA